MVAQYSQDEATRQRGGDLHFFSRSAEKGPDEPNVPDTVRDAAFSLKNIGDVYSSLVATPLGLHIVKLVDKREPFKRSLEEARRTIQNKLWRERREQAVDKFVQELRQKANVQEFPAVLDKVKPPSNTATTDTAAGEANPAASNRRFSYDIGLTPPRASGKPAASPAPAAK